MKTSVSIELDEHCLAALSAHFGRTKITRADVKRWAGSLITATLQEITAEYDRDQLEKSDT